MCCELVICDSVKEVDLISDNLFLIIEVLCISLFVSLTLCVLTVQFTYRYY